MTKQEFLKTVTKLNKEKSRLRLVKLAYDNRSEQAIESKINLKEVATFINKTRDGRRIWKYIKEAKEN